MREVPAAPPARIEVQSNPLWDFTVWAYKEPGVEEACLALQDKHGVDVNILMFCLWLAQIGAGPSGLARYLSGALKLSRDWQRGLVEPLRHVRRTMKAFIANADMAGAERAAASALRERVKACEQDMEHLQVLALHALVQEPSEAGTRSPAEKKDDAGNNLTAYFSATGVKPDPLVQAQVTRILTAVFGA